MKRSQYTNRLAHQLPIVCGVLMLLALVLAGCGSSGNAPGTSGPAQPLLAQDANGTPIVIPAQAPQRIISLTAGDSEMLGALGASARVVAVDVTTDYPAAMAAITPKLDVYSTSATNLTEQVLALKPDLVLSWGGFTTKIDRALTQQGINVVDLPAKDLTGTLLEIQLIGQLIHNEASANSLAASLRQRIETVKRKVQSAAPVTTYMEVGYAPPPIFAYGGGSFGDEIIRDAGGINIFASDSASGGYPAVSVESILKANPQVIILTGGAQYSGTPSSVTSRPGWATLAAVKSGRIYALDPNPIQRPGPRLVDALEQVAKQLHPELFGA
ncbi:MAG: ABC transporter substrate-binding protein [Ktedonobacterales bacterium]|nr:ABC transporter substrate-binding protein [Ktedonobacterales bacterium]